MAVIAIVTGQVTLTRKQVATWDSRIVDLVEFVERERGLDFEHPVSTLFLPEPDFVDLVLASDTDESGQQADVEQALADEAAFYGSLGLAGDYDPSAAQATMDEVLLLGFFDPQTDRIIMRGSELTPEVRSVLVHELTHALQYQHFDLRLGGVDDLVNRSLLEGDAIRIEQRYVATLPSATQQQVEDATALDEGDAALLSDVPWTVTEAQYAPYVLGPSFLSVIEAVGGNDAVNAAMRNPPTPEQLLDPLQYSNTATTTDVASLPPVEAFTPQSSEPIYQSSPFGLFEAVVMLDAWLPWHQTRRALDGWNEAAISVYRTNGVVCSAIAIRVDDRPSADRLAEALRDWSDATGIDVQPAVTDVARGRFNVSFTSCADAASTTPPLPSVTPSYALDFETYFIQDTLATDDGISPRIARCVARRLIDDETFLDLIEVVEWTSEQDDQYVTTVDTLRAGCERIGAADLDPP